ncbi:MAG: sigma-70 family RNA polymerase sigma factor [Lachnospiraceae bacterium]|nr:sigma-70 family RNA polymerase sigma factor [Lachnospiraceae bacterium]
MQDEEIVSLYWKREESAVRETEKKYGRYLGKIAYNILGNWEDSKESVNETYWKAWNSIPPHLPAVLSTYLGKITRQVSIDTWRKRNSKKRSVSEYAVSLSELEECLSAGNVTEQEIDLKMLAASVNQYLRTLPEEARDIFIGRYFFADSIREVAGYSGISESKAKSMLYRMRIGLRAYLEQEGFLDEK